MLGGLGGDFHAALVVGSALSGEDALDLTELTAHLDHHLGGCTAHGVHGEAAEQECHHGTDEHTGQDSRIHQGHVVVVEDIKDRSFGGLHLSGNTGNHGSGALQRYLYLFDVGRQQGEGGQCGGADGEALAGGGGGVAKGVEHVGALAHFRLKLGHLGVAAGVVGDGAVGVGGEGDAKRGEHAHGGDSHTVETLRQVGGGHHVLHVEADCEEVGQHDGAHDGDHGHGGGNHSEADTVDDHGRGTGLGGLRKLLRGFI